MLALAASCCGWSAASQACSLEPYISEVCVMGTNYAPRGYAMANGQSMDIRTNQALAALIGFTYGGTMQSGMFQLPDLRGRFILGAGGQPAGSSYALGKTGGQETAMLGAANLPAMSATVNVMVTTPATAATVDLSTVTANASTLALPATTFSAAAGGLALKASSVGGGGNLAGGNALGTANTPNLKLYVDAIPNVTMRADSIAGTLSGTIAAASAGTALSGAMPVSQAARSVATTTTPVLPGAARPFAIMPPYQAMNFYIATLGYFPPRP